MLQNLSSSKINKEYKYLLMNFPTEDKDYLTMEEYHNLKSNFINQDPSYKELWEEIDTYIPKERKIKKEKLADELSNTYAKAIEIQKDLYSEKSKREENIKKLKKEKLNIDETITKRRISKDSQLFINILSLEILDNVSKVSTYNIKFMFENNIVTSDPIRTDHIVKQTII
jgi:hypothetical protein